jgi:hypothetical protein
VFSAILMMKRALLYFHERRVRLQVASFREQFLSMTSISVDVLNPQTDDIAGFKKFLCNSQAFTFKQDVVAQALIDDLETGHKHHSIHCMSFIDPAMSMIGLTMEEFGNLFGSLLPALKKLFPHSPVTLKPHETSPYASIRFKLFVTIYRMRFASSFPLMSKIFGWCVSSLQEWYNAIAHMMRNQMVMFGAGFLEYMGPYWQEAEINKWRTRHLVEKNDLAGFVHRAREHNADAVKKNLHEIIDVDVFERVGGSIGGVDGTYSICPEIRSAVLEAAGLDPGHDPMYTEYKKCHANKVLLAVSHSIDARKNKFVIAMEIAPAAPADGTLYVTVIAKLESRLIPGACFVGDHAFHTCRRMICPYSANNVLSGRAQIKTAFNHSLSADRMTSEHGVMYMKQWGIFRGRGDIRLFENEENYINSMHCVWSLHNYMMLGCPPFTTT